MKVVFYLSKHAMPFSGKIMNPHRLFDPGLMADWIETDGRFPSKPLRNPRIASEHPFWPMLLALSELECKDVTAHVNAIFGSNAYRFQERTIVLITSSVPISDEYGLPIMRPTDRIELLYEPDILTIFLEPRMHDVKSVDFWKKTFEKGLASA